MKDVIRGIRRHHLQRLKKSHTSDHAIGEGRQGNSAALGRHVNTPPNAVAGCAAIPDITSTKKACRNASGMKSLPPTLQ
jgi:hypothetical protein